VTVQVDYNLDFFALAKLRNILPDDCNFWERGSTVSSVPFTIKIAANQICAIVSNYDTISINHWNDFKDIISSEERSLFGSTEQVCDKSFTDVRALALPWMLPGHNNNNLFVGF
jgi:hypothetical protein